MKNILIRYVVLISFFSSVANAQWRQLGNKIVDTTGNATFASRFRGLSVCISPDGSTLIGASTYSTKGAWIYSIGGGNFTKIASVPIARDTIHSTAIIAGLGQSVSMASDNKTYIIGYPTFEYIPPGPPLPDRLFAGAASVYTSNNNTFERVGEELLGKDSLNGYVLTVLGEGKSVSMSGDGKTVIVGADGGDIHSNISIAWIYTFNGTNYEQLGDRLDGTQRNGLGLGYSVSMSRDGKTAIVGGIADFGAGAAWIYTFNGHHFVQFGDKLTGSGNVGQPKFGNSVSISADGKTAVIGGYADSSYVGAFWVYTFNGTSYVQLGKKILSNDYVIQDATHIGTPWQGSSVAISGDGKTIVVGGRLDNNYRGAAWIYSFNGTNFVPASPKLVGTGWEGVAPSQGNSVSISDDGTKVAVAGYADNYGIGAVWVYVLCSPPKITSLCLDSNNVLRVNATSDFPMQYQWFKESTPLTKGLSTVPGFDITSSISASGGRYSCIVTNGCSSATSPEVQQNDLIGRRILGDFTLCKGDSSHLLANDMKSIRWSTGKTTQSISFLPDSNTTISFTGINNQACPINGIFTITVNSLPNVSLDLSSYNLICDTLNKVSLIGGSPAGGAYLYLNEQKDTLDIVHAGKYPITYSFTAENNCVKAITDTLKIIHCIPPTACDLPNPPCTCPGMVCPLNFKVYTGFTPNGDGINETMVIDSLVPNNTLSILDRWGNEVFYASNYNNEWIGVNKDGKQLPNGVYYYYYVPNGDQKKKSSGSVSIIH